MLANEPTLPSYTSQALYDTIAKTIQDTMDIECPQEISAVHSSGGGCRKATGAQGVSRLTKG